ncbi:MAG: TolC family protein [Puia sp.]|nr:TolC family protein [Puia sp.]
MNNRNKAWLLPLLLFASGVAAAQDSVSRLVKIEELFALAEQNSRQLAISKDGMEVSRANTEIARSARLPELSATVSAGYIGNAPILNTDFSYQQTIKVPHFTNEYGVEGSETLFSGYRIRNGIAKAKLEETLSKLNYAQDKETIKILLLGRYLDLYRLFNQRRVYEMNIQLAKMRLKNISDLHKEGMVIRSDIVRSELQLTDLEVQFDVINSNIEIVNRELCVVLGLPVTMRIQVDTTLEPGRLREDTLEGYLKQAFDEQPAVKASLVNAEIAEKNIELARGAKAPTLQLYAESGLSRPYLYILPPEDIYFNLYQAGIRLKYDISSLYHANERIRLAEIQQSRQKMQSEWVRQQTDLAVSAAYIKYNEAKKELLRREKGRDLADDNYRVVEKRYLNQLALLTDMLDASSAKLAAELNQSDAGINIIYQWYLLQKEIGNL